MNFFPESESVSAQKKRVILKELVKGREAATQLKFLLQNPFRSEPSLSSHELMANMFTSFTNALSVINTSSVEPGSADGVAHRDLLFSGVNLSPVPDSGNHPSPGDCSGKRSQKGGRGRYNRRRSEKTWTELSCTTDDNHAWRKYGQKGILNSEFPRSYFRCSHKYDQGCRATKQVQQDEEYPEMYRTTYFGIHICKATPKITHSATDSSTWESYFLNSDHDSNVQVPLITPPILTTDQEFPKETHTSSDLTDHKLLDPILLSDLKDFEPSNPTIVPLGKESDNTTADNVYSCTDSQRLDMDFEVAFVHFGTDFHFEEGQLL
ncbi:unnamed protein product [Sphenostylis stenocarpa]|uniref:WRKY domain-containing protein n=1 Tax=Sphenostylis stenocarpa TaxID=92480 RepID=A0AA86SQF4_9FABA|nr:unnamed protein product [Sphenostylis stenocarpa]